MEFEKIGSSNMKISKNSSEFLSHRQKLKPFEQTLKDAFNILENGSGYDVKTDMNKILGDKELMGKFIGTLMSPLKTHKDAVSNVMESYATSGYSSKDPNEVNQYMSAMTKAEFLDSDLSFIQERYEGALQAIKENWSHLSFPYHDIVTLPLLYLDAIACNGRHVIPMKNATKQMITRQREVTIYRLPDDPKEYEAPMCFLDKEFMKKFLNQSTGEYFAKVDLTNATDYVNGNYTLKTIGAMDSAGVFTESVDNPITNKKLYGSMRCAWIKVNNGTDDVMIKVKEDPDGYDGTATISNRGKVVYEVELETGKVLMINMTVDFENKKLKITYSAPAGYTLKEMYNTVVLRNYNFATFATSYPKKKDVEKMILKRIDNGLDWDEEQRLDLSDIHNIDMIANVYAGAALLTTHTKDFFIFDTVDEQIATLKEIKDLGGSFTDNIIGFKEDYKEEKVTLIPSETYTGDVDDWKQKRIARNMQMMDADMKRIFNSPKGLTTVWTVHPDMAPFLENPAVVVAKGENYGGTLSDDTVFTVNVGTTSMKGVYSERCVPIDKTDTTNSKGVLKCLPFSHSENQETRSFQQFRTYLDSDGKYRSTFDPSIQSLRISDMFDIFTYQNVAGQLFLEKIHQQ